MTAAVYQVAGTGARHAPPHPPNRCSGIYQVTGTGVGHRCRGVGHRRPAPDASASEAPWRVYHRAVPYLRTCGILFCALLTTPAAWAEGFTLGPSLGNFKSGAGYVYGLDATLLPSRENWSTWLSAGYRGAGTNQGTRSLPYVEAGAWTFVNVGLGATLAAGGGYPTSLLAHAFIGVPLGSFGDAPAIYIEPYWRPAYGTLIDQRGWYSEFGFLVKGGFARVNSHFRF